MRLFFIVYFLILATAAAAQTEISGIVQSADNKPIPGATILLEGTYDGAVTNENGQFQFQTNQSGEKNLHIKFIGFEPQVHTVLLSGKRIELEIKLKPVYNELNTVNIVAGAFQASDQKKAVALNSIDMITVPGAQGNVVGALQYLPGTTTNGESGRLFVRGGNSRESQIYIDGALVPAAYSPSAPNTAVRSRFNPFMFDGTVFSTGGFSAEYGQALSSVLLLETKGIQEQDQLDISVMSVGLGLAGTKKWNTGAITASLDHTNLLPYVKIVPQNIDWKQAPIANNASLNFRQKTKKGLFKTYTAYNDSRFELNQLDLDNGTATNYNLKNTNYYLNSSYKAPIGKKWILKMSGSFTYDQDRVNINTDRFTESLYGGHLKTVFSRKLSNKVKLKTGVEGLFKSFRQNYQTPEASFPNQFDDVTLGSFAETNIYLSKKWVARVGGRFEYSEHLNRTNLSPRFSMAYQLSKHALLSFATGTFYQQANDNYLIYSDQLNYEHTNQFMLNYQYDKNDRMIRTEIYHKAYKNLVKFGEAPFYSPEHYSNLGTGFARGIDFFFRDKKTIRNGDYWISYSYLDTKRNELDYPYAAQPTFASKHNISAVYKQWIRKWRSLVGVSYNFGSPRPYHNPNESGFNQGRTRAFQSLNLNWTYLHRENIIFYASVSNVLGFQQEFGYEFSETPNEVGIYEQRLIEPPAPRFFILACFITLSKSGDQNQLDKIN